MLRPPASPLRWSKLGVIFNVDGRRPWMRSHAQLPTPTLRGELVRVYFSSRDRDGRSRIGFVDADADVPARIRRVGTDPVLDLGESGRFDDSGVMPSCVVRDGARWLLYYVGWTTSVPARHRTAIGLAASEDDGLTFVRVTADPLVDLTPEDSPGASTCFVQRDRDAWRMWFTSTLGWLDVKGRAEERYVIKHATSRDGIVWRPHERTCIEPRRPGEADGRPWVVRDGERYRMWFSYRDIADFRHDRRRSYRIGYAESDDGLRWCRDDDEAGIDCSLDGWDSAMIAYPSIYSHGGISHLLYNGNGFGASGIGHAVAGG